MHHLILSIRFISSTQSCHLMKGMENHNEGKWKPHPFSIAAILGDNFVSVTEESPQIHQQINNGGRTVKYEGNGATTEKNKEIFHSTKNNNICNTPSYSWLHCSRYNPPRVHSKYSTYSLFIFMDITVMKKVNSSNYSIFQCTLRLKK